MTPPVRSLSETSHGDFDGLSAYDAAYLELAVRRGLRWGSQVARSLAGRLRVFDDGQAFQQHQAVQDLGLPQSFLPLPVEQGIGPGAGFNS